MRLQTIKLIGTATLVASSLAPRSSHAQSYDCFDLAASYHHVHPGILRAIAIRENPKCNAAVRRNTNASVDVGCMQINSVHFAELARYKVYPQDLKDPCKNIFVGAWHYRGKILKYGNTWTAVGAYHSETPRLRDQYAAEVYRILIKYGLDRL